jgi:hypothetical protein
MVIHDIMQECWHIHSLVIHWLAYSAILILISLLLSEPIHHPIIQFYAFQRLEVKLTCVISVADARACVVGGDYLFWY